MPYCDIGVSAVDLLTRITFGQRLLYNVEVVRNVADEVPVIFVA